VSALTIMQTLGLMAAAHSVVPLGLLHMCRLQRWFDGLRLDPKRHKRLLVTIPPSVEGNHRYTKTSAEGNSTGASDLLHHGVHAQFGRAEVDLFFFNRRNSHCALCFSMARRDNPPLGVDAFTHEPWPRKLLYAFPPLRLILPLLERVRWEHLSVILVAPGWRSAPWYAEVTQMMVGEPWAVPQVWGALSQESGAMGVLPTLGQPLQAWFLRGTG